MQGHVECAKEVCASWSLSDITRRQSSNTPTSSALPFDILVVSGTLSQVLCCTSSEGPLVNALNRHPNPKGQTEMSHFLPNSHVVFSLRNTEATKEAGGERLCLSLSSDALFVDPSNRKSWDALREIIHQKWLSFNLEMGMRSREKSLWWQTTRFWADVAADEGEYTRFLPVATRYEEASWVCLLPDDKNAAGGSFYSPGKVARGGWISRRLRSRLGKLPAVHFPQSEYSRQLPKHDMLSFRVSRSHAVGTFRLSAVLNTLP